MPLSPTDHLRAEDQQRAAMRNHSAPAAGTVELATGPSAFKRLPTVGDEVTAGSQRHVGVAPFPIPRQQMDQGKPTQAKEQPVQQLPLQQRQAKGQPVSKPVHLLSDDGDGGAMVRTKPAVAPPAAPAAVAEKDASKEGTGSVFSSIYSSIQSRFGQAPADSKKASATAPFVDQYPAAKEEAHRIKFVEQYPSSKQQRKQAAPMPKHSEEGDSSLARAEPLANAVRRARLTHRQAKAEAMRREAQFWSATARAEQQYEASKAVLSGVEHALFARLTGATNAPVEVVPIPPPFPGAAMHHAALMQQAIPRHAYSAIGSAPAVAEAKHKFERAHTALREARFEAAKHARKFANFTTAVRRLEQVAMDELTAEADKAFHDAMACSPDGHVDELSAIPSVFIGSRSSSTSSVPTGSSDDGGHTASRAARAAAPRASAAAVSALDEAENNDNLEAAAHEEELPTNATVFQAIIRTRAAEAFVDHYTSALAEAHSRARIRADDAKQQLETALIRLDAVTTSPEDSGVLLLPNSSEEQDATAPRQSPASKYSTIPRSAEVASAGVAAVDHDDGKAKQKGSIEGTDASAARNELDVQLRHVADVATHLEALTLQSEHEINKAQTALNKAIADRRDAQQKLQTILTGASFRSFLPTVAWFRSWFKSPNEDAEVRADLLRRRVAAAAERVLDAEQQEIAFTKEFRNNSARDAYDLAHTEENLRDAERELAAAIEAEAARLQHNAALGAAGVAAGDMEQIATPNYDPEPVDAAAAAGRAAGNPIKPAGWFRGRFPTLASRETPAVDKKFRGRDVKYLATMSAPAAAASDAAAPAASAGAAAAAPAGALPALSSSSSTSGMDEMGEITFAPVDPDLLHTGRFAHPASRGRQPRPVTPVNVLAHIAAPVDDEDDWTTELLHDGHKGVAKAAHPYDTRFGAADKHERPQQQQTQPQHQPSLLPPHAPVSTDALLVRFVEALKGRRAAEGHLRTTQDAQQAARGAAWTALREADKELKWALKNVSQWRIWHAVN